MKPLWTLVKKERLLDSVVGEPACLSRPEVGPTALAFTALSGAPEFAVRVILRRPGLEVIWNGRQPSIQSSWLGPDHLWLVRHRDCAVWRIGSARVAWTTPLGRAGQWRDGVVVSSKPSEIELRDANGARQRRLRCDIDPFDSDAYWFFDDAAVLVLDGSLACLRFPAGSERWRVPLRDIFGEAVSVPRLLRLSDGGDALVVGHGDAIALVELSTGRVRWRARVDLHPLLPVIAQGRVAFLANGRLFLLDQSDGRVLVGGRGVAETVRERGGVVRGHEMIIVDEYGHILTVDLRDGRRLGLQGEKRASFTGCVFVDDHLLVTGFDGTLRVYARADKGAVPKPRARARAARRVPRR